MLMEKVVPSHDAHSSFSKSTSRDDFRQSVPTVTSSANLQKTHHKGSKGAVHNTQTSSESEQSIPSDKSSAKLLEQSDRQSKKAFSVFGSSISLSLKRDRSIIRSNKVSSTDLVYVRCSSSQTNNENDLITTADGDGICNEQEVERPVSRETCARLDKWTMTDDNFRSVLPSAASLRTGHSVSDLQPAFSQSSLPTNDHRSSVATLRDDDLGISFTVFESEAEDEQAEDEPLLKQEKEKEKARKSRFVVKITGEFVAELESEFGSIGISNNEVALSRGVAKCVHYLLKRSAASNGEETNYTDLISLLSQERTHKLPEPPSARGSVVDIVHRSESRNETRAESRMRSHSDLKRLSRTSTCASQLDL